MKTVNRVTGIFLSSIIIIFLFQTGTAFAEVQVQSHIREDQVWNKFEGPYIVSQNIEVFSDASLTILPGTTVLFTESGRLKVKGRIYANGTQFERIIIDTYNPNIEVFSKNLIIQEEIVPKVLEKKVGLPSDSKIKDEIIEPQEIIKDIVGDEVLGEMIGLESIDSISVGTKSNFIDTGIIISALAYESKAHGQFSYIDFANTGYGVLYTTNAEILIDNASFTDIVSYPIFGINAEAEVTNTSFSGSEYAGMVQAGIFNHSNNIFNTTVPGWMYVPDLNAGKTHEIINTDGVYSLVGQSLMRTATLTIGPGVSLYVPETNNSYLTVEGNLIMKGTLENPISVYSNETCIASESSTFDVFRWWGYQNPVPPDPVVDLEYVHFNNLCNGIKSTHGITTVKNVVFSNIQNEAIHIEGTASIVLQDSILKNNGVGLTLLGTTNAVISSNQFLKNSIGVKAESIHTVDVRNNDWGDNSGPTIESNVSGTGDSIIAINAGEVLYCSWIGKPAIETCPQGSMISIFEEPVEPVLQNNRDPVIIIPGISGSQLYKNYDDNSEVWLNVLKTVANTADSHLDDLSLLVDGIESPVRKMVVGDIIRSAPNIDIFDGLISELHSDGYIDGVDLFVFPYDWRFSTIDTAITLNNKINKILSTTNRTKVDLIAHSMGGVVAKQYIAQYGKEKIDQLFFIGTPHLGAPKAFKTLMYGDTMGVGLDLSIAKIALLNAERIKTISQNMPSVYELLPSKQYFESFGPYVGDLASVYIPSENEEVLTFLNKNQTERLMDQSGRNNTFFAESELLHDQIDSLDLSGIKTYNFSACGATKTIDRILVKRKRPTKLLGITFGKEYELSYVAGDGTVPITSANAVNTDYKYYSKSDSHAKLPSTEMVSTAITTLLNGNSLPFESDIFSSANTICGMSGKTISVHSPVSLDIYGEIGEHVGPVEDKISQINYSIEGVQYDSIEGEKFAYVPDGKSYTVMFRAEDIGVFDISINDSNQNDVITKRRFYYNVPIAGIATKAYIAIIGDGSSDYVLHIDQDGDNIYESARYPVVINGPSVNDVTPPITNSVIQAQTLTLSAVDTETGLLETVYSIDNQNSWHHYSKPLTFTADTSIDFFSVDNLGNTEETKNIFITMAIVIPPVDPVSSGDLENQNPQTGAPSDDSGSTPQNPHNPYGSNPKNPVDDNLSPVESGDGDNNPHGPAGENNLPNPRDSTPPTDSENHLVIKKSTPGNLGENNDDNSSVNKNENQQKEGGESIIFKNNLTDERLSMSINREKSKQVVMQDGYVYQVEEIIKEGKQSIFSTPKAILLARVAPLVSSTSAIVIATTAVIIGGIAIARKYYKKVQ